MVIDFGRTLCAALGSLEHQENYVFSLSSSNRTLHNSCELLSRYADINWKIVCLLNQRYSTDFDLMHSLDGQEDELASFLHEAGSNAVCDSQQQIPSAYHLWLGKQACVIGIEQAGKGFNAREVNERRMKSNQGAGFSFFRACKSRIFFDDPHCARIVFLELRMHDRPLPKT